MQLIILIHVHLDMIIEEPLSLDIVYVLFSPLHSILEQFCLQPMAHFVFEFLEFGILFLLSLRLLLSFLKPVCLAGLLFLGLLLHFLFGLVLMRHREAEVLYHLELFTALGLEIDCVLREIQK